MYPPREQIEQFIFENTKAASIQRAFGYHPEVESESENKLVFRCRGSRGEAYFQTVYIDDDAVKYTSCSCPYSGKGNCKHIVAALKKLARMSDRQKDGGEAADKQTPAEKKQALSYRLNENGEMDFGLLFDDFRKRGLQTAQNDNCRVAGFRPQHWQFDVWQEWQNVFRVTLDCSDGGEDAVWSCNCGRQQKSGHCRHILKAAAFAYRMLGESLLREDYLDLRKAKFLAQYGLGLADDYSQWFDFAIDEDGFYVNAKDEDLVPVDFSFERSIMPAAKADAPKKAEYGLALVLDFKNNSFVGFTVVSGKYNKQGELATHFKELNSMNAPSMLFSGKLSEEEGLIWHDVQRLDYEWEQAGRDTDSAKLAQLSTSFNRFLDKYPELPLFAQFEGGYGAGYARKNLTPLTVSADCPVLSYTLKDEGALYRLEGRLKIGGKIMSQDVLRNSVSPFFILRKPEIVRYPDAATAIDIMRFAAIPAVAMPKKNARLLQKQVLEPLSERCEISGKGFAQSDGKAADQTFEPQVYVGESEGMVWFRPAAQYPDRLIPAAGHALRLSLDENNTFHLNKRNTKAEKAFIKTFESLHPDFQDADGAYFLTPEQLTEGFWFIDFAGRLKENGITLLGVQNLSSFRYNLNRPKLSVAAASGTDWFDLDISISYGDETVGLKELQKAFLKKQNYITLSDGTIGMLPQEWAERLARYFQAGEIKKDKLRLSHYQFGIIDELYDTLETKPEFLTELYERKQRLQNLHTRPDVVLPEGLNATLRPYQQHGLNWLAFLHENKLGGCLADDMGLGKTLQTIAFLHYLKAAEQPESPSLIVAPTSLVFNWQAEVAKFCPGLKLLDHTGQGRLKDTEGFAGYDIVLTSYGTLLQDIEILKNHRFEYVILDESQAIKNPQSQRYKAVRLLKARNRLILSGTPVENHTFDLYAQFNFLNPGLLGSNTHFKKTFSDAIDKNKDTEAAGLLAKIVNPFILRRTKEQVARDLPPKTESILYCEMGETQRKVYDSVKKQYRDYLLEKISGEGIGKSQIHILEGLTRLRQICNSPALLEDADYGSESVKLDTLIGNIKEKTGKHKILVFSGFVKMLALIQARLKKEGIAFEYLDGQTRNRQEKVENFQNDDDVRVFLISTKAGGTGLNLTRADYVFIVDPWWNPAVENQAIDRSYRIGQDKHVMAYRMVCRDSIEEKILALQQKKQRIADSIVSTDDEKKSFDLEAVKNLFA